MSKLFVACLAALVVAGCAGSDKGDGIPDAQRAKASDLSAIAKKADGDLDKVSPADRQKFIDMAHGDEKGARALINLMTHPPNAAGHLPQGAAAGK